MHARSVPARVTRAGVGAVPIVGRFHTTRPFIGLVSAVSSLVHPLSRETFVKEKERTPSPTDRSKNGTSRPVFDAIVVGAGFGGLYALHRLRVQGLSVRVLEAAGPGVVDRFPETTLSEVAVPEEVGEVVNGA